MNQIFFLIFRKDFGLTMINIWTYIGLTMINIFIQLEKPFLKRKILYVRKKKIKCIFLESDLLHFSDVEVISLLYGIKIGKISFFMKSVK